MEGYLKFMVLREIAESPKTGYDLMRNIEKNTGKKPSPGSIYPLLKRLKEDKYINYKTINNKKSYYILNKGEKRLGVIKKEAEKKIKKHLNILKDKGFMSKNITSQTEFMLRNLGVLIEFKKALIKIGKKGTKHEKEVRNILSEAIQKINRLT